MFEGDLGWNLSELEFPLFFDADGEETEQRRYLAFHMAGNGDLLLFDLESSGSSAVVSWSHEEDEFRLLAPTLPEFIERITRLGLIGACADAYEPFLRPDGLEPDGAHGRRWRAWLSDYAELKWEKVRDDLPAALAFVEMHASDVQSMAGSGSLLTDLHNSDQIIREWLLRSREPQPDSHHRRRLLLIGAMLRSAAADWVRSIWTAARKKINDAERPLDASQPNVLPPGLDDQVLHRLAALCLPESEGLPLVLRDLEAKAAASERRMQPPTYSLTPFRSRRVIRWMEPHVAFPFSGWDELLAASRPQAEDLIRWLQGADAQRMAAISAISRLPEGELPALLARPNSEPERAELLRLLNTLHAGAVLRKEKAAILEAIAAVSNT
ncbi:SMI1/KNR4 family protein [Saccharibacillus qingshengii]|uniref:SMI1/KNR4 family protein n=1 Tax=Saccharibacillus qingshengii TaxID=1763540 RepID=UPI0015530592|nr:SMI1/KNR4 family protein [Saccharibacillus qingshengii]